MKIYNLRGGEDLRKKHVMFIAIGILFITISAVSVKAEEDYLYEEEYYDDEYYYDEYDTDEYSEDYAEKEYTSVSQLMDVVPTWSPEYIETYITNIRQIDLGDLPDKMNDILERCNNFQDLISIKKDTEIFGGEYYAKTKEDGSLYYFGEMKNGRPDGVGEIYEVYTLNMNRSLVRTKYRGEFKKGRFSGFGILYEDKELEDDVENELYDIEDEDIAQEALDKYFTPVVYIGEFSKNQPNGNGANFVYPEITKLLDLFIWGAKMEDLDILCDDILITSGEFKDGNPNGDVKIYYCGSVIYEGTMKDGNIDGKGKIYYPESDQLKYEGELKENQYHGKGTEYSEDGEVLYSGKWKNGDYDS